MGGFIPEMIIKINLNKICNLPLRGYVACEISRLDDSFQSSRQVSLLRMMSGCKDAVVNARGNTSITSFEHDAQQESSSGLSVAGQGKLRGVELIRSIRN